MDEALLALPFGLLVGLLLGLVGGGGSILAVPVLVYVLDQSQQAATSDSLLIVGLTALIGALDYGRAGRLRLQTGLVFALAGGLGSLPGTAVNRQIGSHALLLGFSAVLLAAGAAERRRALVNVAFHGDGHESRLAYESFARRSSRSCMRKPINRELTPTAAWSGRPRRACRPSARSRRARVRGALLRVPGGRALHADMEPFMEPPGQDPSLKTPVFGRGQAITVATGCHGLPATLFPPLLRQGDLPLIATGCARWAP